MPVLAQAARSSGVNDAARAGLCVQDAPRGKRSPAWPRTETLRSRRSIEEAQPTAVGYPSLAEKPLSPHSSLVLPVYTLALSMTMDFLELLLMPGTAPRPMKMGSSAFIRARPRPIFRADVHAACGATVDENVTQSVSGLTSQPSFRRNLSEASVRHAQDRSLCGATDSSLATCCTVAHGINPLRVTGDSPIFRAVLMPGAAPRQVRRRLPSSMVNRLSSFSGQVVWDQSVRRS